MTAQDQLHLAFRWVDQCYDEARTLLGDVARAADERGLKSTGTSTGYGTTLRKTDARQDDHPFLYLAADFYYPPELEEAATGVAAFLAISFFDLKRHGPFALAGVVRWSDWEAKLDHWLVNATGRMPGWRGAFEPKKDGELTHHKPTDQARKLHPHISSVDHVEFPLTALDGAAAITTVVDALVAAREGDVERLRPLAKLQGSGSQGG